jgi:hypothetical protein
MASCGYCRSTIIAGGVKDGQARYCNEKCYQRGKLVALSGHFSPEEVREAVQQVHRGLCPKCGGSGPVDVSVAHKVWSAGIITSWSSTPQVSCRSCGRKGQAGGLVFSFVLGWWGIPWGFIMTPVQLARNITGLMRDFDPYQPSPQLEDAVRLSMAAELVERTSAADGG